MEPKPGKTVGPKQWTCSCGGRLLGHEREQGAFSVKCESCGKTIEGLHYYCGRCGERETNERGRLCNVCDNSYG
jgi:hypothetical protein